MSDGTVDPTVTLDVLARLREGDFSVRMPNDWVGLAGKVADGLNDVIVANEALGVELARVSDVVGKQGRLGQRITPGGLTQRWAGAIESVNSLIDDLVGPTIEMQRVIGAVADGDLSKQISADVRGEMLELKNTINAMVDQLNGFISEVTRVTREVGTEGKLGQAAAVTIEVGGVWKELTDNVNQMAANLTGQVRNIAEVTTAVANGDLSKKISIAAQGEVLELKNTVNAMVEQLKTFAGEVTRVAREVGVEGKLGGQAQSAEVEGVWAELTENVNQLAANLTNQVRAIAEVATAVTEGDLTRQVTVEASGEVAGLREKLNEMIRNLRETTRQNVEQDWLKTNLGQFNRMLQGQDDLADVSTAILAELATLVSAQHGVFYTYSAGAADGDEAELTLQASYAYEERKHLSTSFRLGDGLVGQCAKEKKTILLTNVPNDYVKINSGLGEAVPLNIIVLPVLFEGALRAVIELASFSPFSQMHQTFLDSITESVGIVISTINASAKTETLLQQSKAQAETLLAQQEAMRESNQDLERQARQLADQNIVAESKNREIEEAKLLVDEKAEQLMISSKYKSEFIANMSHELRTPLNSLLILAEQLRDNVGGTMSSQQVEYAAVIHSSGCDLLALLNEILDLAKVESGTMTPVYAPLSLPQLRVALLSEFEPVARAKGLAFSVECETGAPEELVTDSQRLRQILKNLIANAFKFTERGAVDVVIRAAEAGIAIVVRDTGIGISDEQQQRIFEAFAQGDGSTARIYGGTGLGLSISRELVSLLGGEITVTSELGVGSAFTVTLPSGSTAQLGAETRPPAAAEEPAPVSTWQALEGVRVLVVDDDERNLFAMSALLNKGAAVVTAVQSGVDALALLEGELEIDIVLMDIMMPVLDGYETMRRIRGIDRLDHLRIIAVTGKATAGERQRCLDAGADDYVPKPVDPAQLLAALRPWLPGTHAARAPRRDRELLPDLAVVPEPPVKADASAVAGLLAGLKVMVVDDDFRNIFAMTALLERGEAVVTVVESGADALAVLVAESEIDIVLMDIMMPVMDGYETMRRIRANDHLDDLPIIAVTGKATAGERQRCLDAGANDYVPKPVDTAELLAALRPWLPARIAASA